MSLGSYDKIKKEKKGFCFDAICGSTLHLCMFSLILQVNLPYNILDPGGYSDSFIIHTKARGIFLGVKFLISIFFWVFRKNNIFWV